MLDRLPNKVRMDKWNPMSSLHCEFCYGDLESRDHLLFSCLATVHIWKKVLLILQIDYPIGDWQFELTWALNHRKGKNLHSVIYKLAFTVFIYKIWREMNNRIFRKAVVQSDAIMGSIIRFLQLRHASVPQLKAKSTMTLIGRLLYWRKSIDLFHMHFVTSTIIMANMYILWMMKWILTQKKNHIESIFNIVQSGVSSIGRNSWKLSR